MVKDPTRHCYNYCYRSLLLLYLIICLPILVYFIICFNFMISSEITDFILKKIPIPSLKIETYLKQKSDFFLFVY